MYNLADDIGDVLANTEHRETVEISARFIRT
jgi:hypothetical protein